MKAIIEVDIPDYQIGQEVSIYFKDTMNVYGVCEAERTGHWIKGDINEGIYCSECNENALTDYDFHYIRSNFCPNCGCRMVEPQEKRCADCNHYGKLSLDCGRCDDDCSMFEPQESEET